MGEWCLHVLILIQEPLVVYSLHCPAEEGRGRAAFVGPWHPARVNLPQSHSKKLWASGMKVRRYAQRNFSNTGRLAEMFIQVLKTLFWFSAASEISLIWIISENQREKRLEKKANIHYCSECTIARSPKRLTAFNLYLRNLNINIGTKGNTSKSKAHKSTWLHKIWWIMTFLVLRNCFHGCC